MNALSLITDGFLVPVGGVNRYLLPLNFNIKDIERLNFLIKKFSSYSFSVETLVKIFFQVKQPRLNFQTVDKNNYNFTLKICEDKK